MMRSKQIKSIKITIILIVLNCLLTNAQLNSNELTISQLDKHSFVQFNQIKEDNQNSQRNQFPLNFTVDVVSSNSIRLKWQSPAASEIAVLQFKIKYEKLNSNKQDTITVDSKYRTYLFENLDSDSDYRFRIGALFVNDNHGPFTKWKQVQTLKELDEKRVPEKPEHLIANGKGTKLYLKWLPPFNHSIRVREYLLNFGVNFPGKYTL